MGPLPPHADDRAIWDLWESQFRLPVATVADEVGAFRALGNAPMTTAELAKELGVDRAYARRMMRLTLLPPRTVEAALAGEDVGSLAGLARRRALEWWSWEA